MNFLRPSPGSIRAAIKRISVLLACLWLLLHHFEQKPGNYLNVVCLKLILLLIRVFVFLCHNGVMC